MNRKLFFISFVITNLILGAIFCFLTFSINQDEKGFKSNLPTINSQTLIDESNYVICVISYGCSSRPKFMPELKLKAPKIKEKGYKLYVVNDSEYSLEAENEILNLRNEYKIDDQVYFIDPVKYSKNGGLLYSKKRYFDFVTDLSKETKNLELGYAHYVVFKNNKLLYDDYELKEDML